MHGRKPWLRLVRTKTELDKTIFDAEWDRRVVAVNYARESAGLEGFSPSAADEEHAQWFIKGDINFEDFE